MKNSKKKIFWIIIVTLGAIGVILVAWIGGNVTDSTFQNVILTFSVITAWGQFLYNNSNDVFIFLNKYIISFFLNTTSAWTASHLYYVKDFDMEKEYKCLIDVLTENGWEIQKKKCSKDIIEITGKLNNIPRTFQIFKNEKIDFTRIRFQYSSAVNSKRAMVEWKRFKKVATDFEQELPLMKQTLPQEYKTIYTISIKLDKYNPFYRLSLRHLEKPKNMDFRLTFTENDVDIKIEPHTIEASGQNIEDIEQVISDYIVMSRLI